MSSKDTDDNQDLAEYACDSCRRRKVTCSRQRSGCSRCERMGVECTYSRSGIIKRNRKRKPAHTTGEHSIPSPAPVALKSSKSRAANDDAVQSHLMSDVDSTRDVLTRTRRMNDSSTTMDALLLLSEASVATDFTEVVANNEHHSKRLYLFKDQADQWTTIFQNATSNTEPLLSPPPEEVLSYLRTSRPHLVREKAWLVMFYSIILNTPLPSLEVKEQLQHNLWLVLGDVSVLLKPSENNIQALLLVLSITSEVSGPSLSWMLATNMCRMFQALGVDGRHLDTQTRKRRRQKFWHLNLVDKAMAIIFGRTPTFHPSFVRDMGMPTTEEIRAFRPHELAGGAQQQSYFALHLMYQKILLSHIMADIWDCLYGGLEKSDESIQHVVQRLSAWYEKAQNVLEASALSERLFCDAQNSKALDVGLATLEFQYLYLTILLCRCSLAYHDRMIRYSVQMLSMLPHLCPEEDQPYHPFIWQLVCSPFAAFLALFRAVVPSAEPTTTAISLEEKTELLAAMERLPPFLECLVPRNRLAAKLKDVARTLVRHARLATGTSVLDNTGNIRIVESVPSSASLDTSSSYELPSGDGLFTPSTSEPAPDSDWELFLSEFAPNLGESGHLDWLNWDSQGLSAGHIAISQE